MTLLYKKTTVLKKMQLLVDLTTLMFVEESFVQRLNWLNVITYVAVIVLIFDTKRGTNKTRPSLERRDMGGHGWLIITATTPTLSGICGHK